MSGERTNERDVSGPSPPQGRIRYFSVFVWPVTGVLTEQSEIPQIPELFYQSPDGIRRIPLARNVASPLLPIVGDPPLDFFYAERVEIPPPPESPPGTPPTFTWETTPVQSLAFPESWDQVLFVMMPARSGRGADSQFLPVRYDTARVRPGYVRILNTTAESLIVDVNGELLNLPPNGPVDFQPSAQAEHQVLRINVFGRDERNDSVRLRLTTRISAREATSNLYLLYPDSPRRLRLMRVGGHEPPPTPTPVPPPPPAPRR